MNSIDKALTKLKDFEPIDVLVNNADHGYRAAIEEGEDTRIQQLYATNLFGPIKLIQKLLPHCLKNVVEQLLIFLQLLGRLIKKMWKMIIKNLVIH